VVSSGEWVLATGHTKLRGKGSGVEIRIEWGQVFRFRDGKIVRSSMYSDPAEARREYEAQAV
jgi:ketosteroid isomerase-like protein